MVSLLLRCSIDEKDSLVAELYDRSTTGIVESDQPDGSCVLEAFFDSEAEGRTVMNDCLHFGPELRAYDGRDFIHEFQQHWPAASVGERFWLAPPWDSSPVPAGRLRIDYQTGMACGSGLHPCTRLCVAAVEKCVRPGDAVLDVGVGSGILLIAAGLLGAGTLAGCDTDFEPLAAARIVAPRALLFTGSTNALRDRSFDVVIANISSLAAVDLQVELRRICRGTIIVSGFHCDDLPEGYCGEPSVLEEWAAISEAVNIRS